MTVTPRLDFFVSVTSLFRGFARWLVFAVALVPSIGHAQSPAPISSGQASAANHDETITLSSFMIDSKAETAWAPSRRSRAAGMETDFNNLATPIKVMTKTFLDDLGLNNSTRALPCSTSTERREDVVTGEGFSLGLFRKEKSVGVL